MLAADMTVDFEQSQGTMACLTPVHKELQSNGLMKEAHAIHLTIAKERRRLRERVRKVEDLTLALEDRTRRADEQERAVRRHA